MLIKLDPASLPHHPISECYVLGEGTGHNSSQPAAQHIRCFQESPYAMCECTQMALQSTAAVYQNHICLIDWSNKIAGDFTPWTIP